MIYFVNVSIIVNAIYNYPPQEIKYNFSIKFTCLFTICIPISVIKNFKCQKIIFQEYRCDYAFIWIGSTDSIQFNMHKQSTKFARRSFSIQVAPPTICLFILDLSAKLAPKISKGCVRLAIKGLMCSNDPSTVNILTPLAAAIIPYAFHHL